MNEEDKIVKDFEKKENSKLNLTKFFKDLDEAISTHNVQSIYQLSKIFTRYYFKDVNN